MTLYDITKGEAVELRDDFAVSLKKSNVLFAFDNIQCERTLSFDIPDTPRNNRLFSDGKDINKHGGGMRIKHAAQLQGSMVTMDGDLYITEYSEDAYKAVFVTGEMFGLRALKNAGKLSEYIKTNALATWGVFPYPPSTEKESIFAQIVYGTDREQPLLSIRLHSLIELAMQTLNVPVTLPEATQYVRIIPESLNGAKETTVRFASIARAMSLTDHPICYDVSLDALANLVTITTARVRRQVGTLMYMGRFEQFQTLQELQLEFPDDWGDDNFVGYYNDGDTNQLAEFSFYGDRSFDYSGTVIGESLRGRSVTIPQGDKFVVINKACWANRQTSSGLEYGWLPYGMYEDLQISGGEITVGSVVRLQDNLPDVDVVSLLKTVAALSGLQLYYEEGAGVSFVTGEKTGILRLENNIISKEIITRTFVDYAQKNVVKFKSEELLPERDKLSISYNVENENLAGEKTLAEIPYSEGLSNGLYDDQRLIYTRATALADADTSAPALVRVGLQRNEVLDSLCTNSTSLRVRARMTLVEFQRLRASIYIVYNYADWMWTAATWSDGVATIDLSKVDADV